VNSNPVFIETEIQRSGTASPGATPTGTAATTTTDAGHNSVRSHRLDNNYPQPVCGNQQGKASRFSTSIVQHIQDQFSIQSPLKIDQFQLEFPGLNASKPVAERFFGFSPLSLSQLQILRRRYSQHLTGQLLVGFHANRLKCHSNLSPSVRLNNKFDAATNQRIPRQETGHLRHVAIPSQYAYCRIHTGGKLLNCHNPIPSSRAERFQNFLALACSLQVNK
jgi:hypothetical protein